MQIKSRMNNIEVSEKKVVTFYSKVKKDPSLFAKRTLKSYLKRGIWKEAVVISLKCYSGICSEGSEKTRILGNCCSESLGNTFKNK